MCPALHRTPCKTPCHCEGATRPWQSATPVPLAPLPKGGWHGEAVTGGFLTGTFLSNLRRGRCLHRPAHRTSCKNHVIARPVRKLAVAIRIPRPLGPLPKGGWHGEAVTGGFFTSPHLLQPFRRGGVLPRPFFRAPCNGRGAMWASPPTKSCR